MIMMKISDVSDTSIKNAAAYTYKQNKSSKSLAITIQTTTAVVCIYNKKKRKKMISWVKQRMIGDGV